VAYWDWSMVSANPWQTEFPSLWHDGANGMGGNSPRPGDCVDEGPFRETKWNLPDSADPPKCLKRNFNGKPPDAVAVASK